MDDPNLHYGGRTSEIVERSGDVAITTLDQFIESQVLLMGRSARALDLCSSFAQNALAQTLERDFVKLSKNFPIALWDVAGHDKT
jgi:hypothetical protein